MKDMLSLALVLMSLHCCGGVSTWNSNFEWSGVKWNKFEMTGRGLPGGGVSQDLLACVEDGWILIAAQLVIDSAPLSADSFSVTFNTESYMASYHQGWTVAHSGDVVGYDTTHGLDDSQYLIHVDPSNPGKNISGPVQLVMEKSSDIYLAFTCSEQYDEAPSSIYYGWVQLGIDKDGNISVLGSAVDFDHGPMVVGGGAYTDATPEPSAGVLFLLGAAALGLRRRGRRVLSNRSGRFKPI